jgi:hypothetical protein
MFKLLSLKRRALPVIAGLVVCQAYALDESRLWLAKNHEKLYLDLRAAAKSAEALERCVTVLRGTLDLEQSAPDHPIFRIQCRQENGRTYNEMVDGLSKETLTTKLEKPKELSEEDIAAQKQIFLDRCMQLFEAKTSLFKALKLKEGKPEPESFTMQEAKYYLDFDAENVEGQPLSYRTICMVTGDLPPEIHIRKRRD